MDISASGQKQHRFVLILAVGSLLVNAAREGETAVRPTGNAVTLSVSKSARLPDVLAEFHRATGRVVVAEPLAIERKLSRDLKGVPLSEGLDEASRAFDLYWQQRPGHLVFHRRFRDPLELPRLEIAELAAVSADLARLVRPFAPYPLDEGYIRHQNTFARLLTTPQMEVMRREGLPFAQLTPEQQKHWLQINAASVFSSVDMEWERVARTFGHWKGAALEYVPTESTGPQLFFQYPNVPGAASGEGFQLGESDQEPPQVPAAAAEGEVLPPRAPKLPATLQAKVELPEGENSLQGVVTAVEQAIGATIRVPSYARSRRLLVYARGATAAALLTALEDLYGWTLTRESERRWILDRPRIPPAAHVRDLHRKVVAALPPPLRLVLRAHHASGALYSARLGPHYSRIIAELRALKKQGWTRFPVSEMPAAIQQRLANLIFLVQTQQSLGPYVAEPEPRWIVVAPETGIFTIEGLSTLKFNVSRPDGKTDGWGWAIGTSSLQD